MRRPNLLAVLAVAVLAAACATEAEDMPATTTTTERPTTTTTEPDETTTTTEAVADVELPDGFELLEGDGVSIGVPSSWVALDLDDGEFERLLEDVVEANPELEEVLTAQVRQLAAAGAVLFAIDLVPDGDFSSNVNVIRVPGVVPDDPADLEATAEAGIRASGGEVLDLDVVTLPAGETLRVEYETAFPGPEGEAIDVHGLQYYVLGDRGYVVTVSLPAGEEVSLAEQIADTFRET